MAAVLLLLPTVPIQAGRPGDPSQETTARDAKSPEFFCCTNYFNFFSNMLFVSVGRMEFNNVNPVKAEHAYIGHFLWSRNKEYHPNFSIKTKHV